MRSIALRLATFVLVCCSSQLVHADAPPPFGAAQIGRYQMMLGPNKLICVIDTATGQCWSKLRDGWIDEGNPTKRNGPIEKKAKRDKQPLALTSPLDKIELAIKQRESRSIPGTNDRVSIRLDDITGGQVLLSVHVKGGKTLLDAVSAKQGDVVTFQIGDTTVQCRIKELKNFLTSNDIAIVELTSNTKDAPVKTPPEGRETDTADGRD